MYEYDGLTYTEKQLKDYAAKNNIDFDTYMSNMRQIGMTSKDDGNDPIGRWQSFKNSLYNTYEQVDDLTEFYFSDEGAGSSLDIASSIIYESIFGKEKMKDWQKTSMGKWFFQGYESTDSKAFQDILKKFEEERKAHLESLPEDDFNKNYPFSVENVEEFVKFVKESGGFQIC